MKTIIKTLASLLIFIMSICVLLSCDNTEEPSGDGGLNGPGGTQEQVKQGTEIGEICPTMPLELIGNEGTVDPKDYRGKVVVLNFWGTWCPPCKNELPHFDRVASEYKDEVVIITIHSVNGQGNAEQYVSDNFPTSDMIFAKDSPLMQGVDVYYSLSGGEGYYPRTVILDKDGIITYADEMALSYEQLKSLVEAAR